MKARFALVLLLSLVPSRAEAKGCHEVSDLVGERRCSRFGDFWSHERSFPVVLSIGVGRFSLAPDDRNWQGHFGKNGPTAYEFQGRDLGSSFTTWGPTFGLGGYIGGWLYVGTEWAFAFGHASTRSFDADGYDVEPASGVNAIDARFGVVFGTRARLSDTLSLRVDFMPGLEVASLMQRAGKPNEARESSQASHLDFLLGTRFTLDLWTTPWTTMGVWLGTKPLHVGDVDTGIVLALHGRPHDG